MMKRVIIGPSREMNGTYVVAVNPDLVYLDTCVWIEMFQAYRNKKERIIDKIAAAVGNDDFRLLVSVVNFLELIGTDGDISAHFTPESFEALDYYEQAIGEFNKKSNAHLRLASIIGIVDAARVDIEAGYLQSFEQLIHSEIFADYLEMAGHLIETGYKDAAAVIAGSTVEAHLKQLGEKYEVDIENGGKPKKADALNAELVKTSAYSKLDQKNVTAWLGLRNNAAHGSYGEYDIQQVRLFLAGIQDFITRNPA